VSEVALESPLPRSLPAGSQVALFCSGTACEAKSVELVIDAVSCTAKAVAMPRFDMPCRRSGFWAVVPVALPRESSVVKVEAAVRFLDGRRERVVLSEIAVDPVSVPVASEQDLIAICMGTFDPDPEMLRAQLESIRAQSDTRWMCVISDDHSGPERYEELCSIVGDDERFVISRAESQIGFYRNFERALQLAPDEAGLIALCDQDDVWHPDKLAVLRRSLGSAMLVYSDQRLIDERGRLLRETLWRGRANNTTNMASMLIANTVTGASSLFRREVAERALPFPDSPGIEFHDHWLALVALASGELAYVAQPLYDYRQHPGAILGKVTESADGLRSRRRLVRRPRMREWRSAYFLGYVPGEIRARTLLLRCTDRLTPRKRRALQLYLASSRNPAALLWFVLRPLRILVGRSETLGGEWEFAIGIVWRWLAGLIAKLPGWPDRFTLDTRFPDPPRFEQRRLRRWREQT
jgi:glycosyltransferase involved in cell wall biosynthesis